MEKEIELEQEAIVVYSGGGAVNSVNGYTGDVVLTTSDLENTSDYQTGTEVESAISTAIEGKQDTLTAGNNITISNNTISATDTTYSAGTGLTLDGTQFSVNTETIATQQDVSNEATARETADAGLQSQIDAITASSDVKDIVGTKAELNNYDTSTLGNNDIIKVLQDESENDATTYYRWNATTQQFTLIGEEGPYYTKSQADTLLNAKQNTLTAGPNVQIVNDTISATDTTYTAGTGLALNGTQFSVDTTAIATQSDLTAGLANKQDTLTAGANIQINNNTISATDTTYSNFTGTDGSSAGAAGLVPAPATTDAGKFLKADGTWSSAGGGGGDIVYSTKNTSNSANGGAVYIGGKDATQQIYLDPSTTDNHRRFFWALPFNGNETAQNTIPGSQTVNIGGDQVGSGNSNVTLGYRTSCLGNGNVMIGFQAGSRMADGNCVCIGYSAECLQNYGTALGKNSKVNYGHTGSVALGAYAGTTRVGEVYVGTSNTNFGYNSTNYRVIGGVHDGQELHDAATVAQGNTLSTSAPTTSTVGVLGQLYTDTTNMHTYQCTAISGSTYTWTQRW